ncbi:MAG: DUF3592 domain-containing protein [Victivallaceae bacterium]|jgi:hypothetical protein
MSIMLQNNNSGGVPGKIGTSLFMVMFAMFGMMFIGFMAYTFVQGAAAQSWTETPCRIVAGEIVYPKHSGSKYSYKVEYSYVYNGRTYSAARLSFSSSEGEYKKILQLSRDYPPGRDANCYVNPSNPSDAVLVRKVKWDMLPFMIIPLIFVAVGIGGIYFTWKKKKLAALNNNTAAIPQPLKSGRSGRYALCVFFGIFLLVGVFAGYFTFIKPVLKIWLSANWPQVPCVIESSRVASSSGKSTTYSAEVIFRYQYQGIAHIGDKYDFISGSSSGYDSSARIAGSYFAGRKTFCHVNPDNPDEAVLSRNFRPELWIGLIPAVFALVGFCGIIGALRYGKKVKVHVYEQPAKGGGDFVLKYDGVSESVLQPVSTPLKTLAGITIAAIFWNAIVSVFVFQAGKSWSTNNVEWFLSFFMIPFVLVGLLLIFLVLHTLLQAFNPRPVLKLDPASPALGGKAALSWEIPDYRSITRLEITLEGYEEAKSRSGNNNTIAKSVFEQIGIADTVDRREITAGNAAFTVPRESMHTFDADSNKIIWRLKLKGKKRFFPDLNYEYAVNVMPSGIDRRRL